MLAHAVLAALVGLAPPAATEIPETCYLFTYFVGNGEDGLHLAWSRDGYAFETLGDGRSYLTPSVGESKLMRDPCLLLGPDGVFRLVWTTSWAGKTIGYASSRDLLAWSEQRAIPVMAGEPEAENCWAPEIAYDPEAEEYLIFWATTIPGRFAEPEIAGDSNHRMFATSTRDFEEFTPTRLFFDPGMNVIDATLLTDNGRPVRVDGLYRLIFKEETLLPEPAPAKRQLRLASADRPSGPFEGITAPFTRHGVEGPCALRVDGAVVVYYDIFTEGRYGACRSVDLATWEDVTEQLSMPEGARHGTVLTVPGAVVERLLADPVPDGPA